MKRKTGILLVNLGTPDSPQPRDVYRYLIEFLTDKRVIDMPWLQRQLLVRGIIVPSRYRQSAASYKKIWTKDGSPLKVYGYRVKEMLQARLGDDYYVELAMRYQQPTVEAALESMRKQHVGKIIIFPMFPQYASATTGSVHDKVMSVISNWQSIPEMVFIQQYANHPGFINAIGKIASNYDINSYDHVLMSFHGLPQEQLIKADCSNHCLKAEKCCAKLSKKNQHCYSAQCHSTANALVKTLNLKSDGYSLSFQSRLGKKPWLQPYTSDVIHNLAKQGKKRVLVFCPAFTCDCLETIYEIGIEYADEFKQAGGESLDLVPGLNDHPSWIEGISSILSQ